MEDKQRAILRATIYMLDEVESKLKDKEKELEVRVKEFESSVKQRNDDMEVKT